MSQSYKRLDPGPDRDHAVRDFVMRRGYPAAITHFGADRKTLAAAVHRACQRIIRAAP